MRVPWEPTNCELLIYMIAEAEGFPDVPKSKSWFPTYRSSMGFNVYTVALG